MYVIMLSWVNVLPNLKNVCIGIVIVTELVIFECYLIIGAIDWYA